MKSVTGYEIAKDSGETGHESFASLRKLSLRPRFSDGSSGELHDIVVVLRKGLDAVAVLPYVPHPRPLETLTVLRAGQRPAVWLRRQLELPIPEPEAPALLWEAVAGIREWSDHGADGLRRRAAVELEEEIGMTISPERLVELGPAFLPTPGLYPEKIFLYRVEVTAQELATARAVGDGSVSEAGALVRAMTLGQALAGFASGELVDGKTELALHRLLAHLRREP